MADTEPGRGKYARVGPTTCGKPTPALTFKNKIQGDKSWRAPVTMISTLIAGLGVALAHHVMNVSLNHKVVTEVVLSQAWVSRFGTALAFLVKVCFVITVSVAFVQKQWFNFHQQPFQFKDIDALTNVLGNIFSFFDSSTWLRNPTLTLMAIVSWTIPFAAIVTPASLSVVSIQTPNTTSLQVSQPYFANYSAFAIIQSAGDGSQVAATSDLYKLAYNAASSGQPILVPTKYQNETYHLDFAGPTVRCSMANASVIRDITMKFGSAYQSFNTTKPYNNTHTNSSALIRRYRTYADPTPFVSWVAGDNTAVAAAGNGSYRTYLETLDQTSLDSARVFIMTNAQSSWKGTSSVNSTLVVSDGQYIESYTIVNVTECALWNATYSVDFNITAPRQELTISISEYLNPVAAPDSSFSQHLWKNDTAGAITSYSAIMRAFGKLLVGEVSTSHYGQISTYGTSYDLLDIDWSRAEAVQTGLEQLFQNITLSTLSNVKMRKNSTQADSVRVDVLTWPITYSYQAADLLRAYGLSFLCALISCIIGMHAFFVNDASYQNIFSTFIRATNDAELRSMIDSDDAGADPLPKDLAKIKVMMGDRPTSEKE